MRYFILRRDPSIEWGALDHPDLPDDASLLRGASLDVAFPEPFVLTVDHPPEEPPLHLLGDELPVVSERFVSALIASGVDNFDSWPVALENPEVGMRWGGYQAINVIGMVAAVRLDASPHTVILGADPVVPALVDFEAVVLDGRRTLDLRMFRVPESPGLWFIDEGVVEALRARRPPEGWGITVQEVEVR